MTIAVKKRLQTGDALAPQTRSIGLGISPRAEGEKRAVAGLDESARTLTITFSSEAPVARWFGAEVLSHTAGAADMSRLNDGAPLLFNHNMDDILGVVESASIGADRRGHAVVRFAKTPRGDEMLSLVADGIVRNVSFMYTASDFSAEDIDPDGDGDAVYTAQRWLAYEISLVSVPADQSVGVGRAATAPEQIVTVQSAQPQQALIAATAANPNPSGEDMLLKRTLLMSAVAAMAATGGGSDTGGRAAAAASIDLVAEERTRTESIVALGRKHNLSMEKIHDMISRGVDIAGARGEVLDGMLQSNKPVASLGNANADLTDKEKRNYSVVRAVAALVSGSWEKAGFEREVSNEIGKRTGKESQRGFFMPTDLPFAPDLKHARAYNEVMGKTSQTRAPYQVGSAAQGGNLVQTQLLADNFIEVLRNTSVTAQLGARYLTDLTGNIDIPRQSGATTMGWVGESQGGNETEAVFDKVSLRPKTITAYSVMSRLMMLQSTPGIEMLARADLLAQAALGIDLAALSGSGSSNQPTGIVNQSGVVSVVGGANGANLTFDQIIQLKSAPRIANAPLSNLGFALNSKCIGYLETLKATTGQYLWSNDGSVANGAPRTLKGENYVGSQQMRSNLTKGTAAGVASEIIYGNWLELLIGMWGVMEIAVNPYDSTGFKNGDVLLRIMQTCDIAVRHGNSFAVMSDALTPGF